MVGAEAADSTRGGHLVTGPKSGGLEVWTTEHAALKNSFPHRLRFVNHSGQVQ